MARCANGSVAFAASMFSISPWVYVCGPEYAHPESESVALDVSSAPPPQPALRTSMPSTIARMDIRCDIRGTSHTDGGSVNERQGCDTRGGSDRAVIRPLAASRSKA